MNDLNTLVQHRARGVWRRLQREYPELAAHDMPTVKLNGRLWRTAGRCFQETQTVELGTKFFVHNASDMIQTILPHEMIHAADWILHGESEKKCGHGVTWQKMMLQYGLEANPFHCMVVIR